MPVDISDSQDLMAYSGAPSHKRCKASNAEQDLHI